MEDLDLVVPVRESAVNPQLRYALRSWVANLPHRRLWVVGHMPPWVNGARHIPLRQGGTKYRNTTAAVRAACESSGVSDRFLLCNDDFFVMRPQKEMPVLHRGLVRDVEADYAARVSSSYLEGMRQTRALLAEFGIAEPYSYELHVPLPVEKTGMLDALDVGEHLPVLHKRTAYGNLAGIGGEQIEDVKILHRAPRGYGPESEFLSTMPDAFTNGHVGQFIRAALSRPCRYEKAGRR
ncbi:hypothetical protein [Streptomyces sp. NPDC047070]|uniref:hypothetical protein n=1 Tax=Streptomyces sp. NPDC047070 TaxID=3154923 RepID=UPI003455E83B